MTRAFKLYSPKEPRDQPEARLQRAVYQHMKINGTKGAICFAVPNGLKSDGRHVNRMKALGLLPGVSDLIILFEGKAYCLELKAKGGHQTDSQMSFQAACEATGVPYEVADNIEQAICILRTWGVLKPMVRAA